MLETPSRIPMNLDVKCLRCGAFNIPENQICGKCGANLPLLYTSEGKVLLRGEDYDLKAVVRKQMKARGPHPEKVRWLLRFGVIFAALIVALFIMSHHH